MGKIRRYTNILGKTTEGSDANLAPGSKISCSTELSMKFSLLINVKMQTTVFLIIGMMFYNLEAWPWAIFHGLEILPCITKTI